MFSRKIDVVESQCEEPPCGDVGLVSSFAAAYSGENVGGKSTTSTWSPPARNMLAASVARFKKQQQDENYHPIAAPISVSSIFAVEAAIQALEQSIVTARLHPVPDALSEIAGMLKVLEDSDSAKRSEKGLEQLEMTVNNALKSYANWSAGAATGDPPLTPEAVFDAFRQLSQVQLIMPSLDTMVTNLQELRRTEACWSQAMSSGRLSSSALAAVNASAREAEKALDVLEKMVDGAEQKVEEFIQEAQRSISDLQSQFDELSD